MHGSSHSEHLYVPLPSSAETDGSNLYGIDQGDWYRVIHRMDYSEVHMLDKGFQLKVQMFKML